MEIAKLSLQVTRTLTSHAEYLDGIELSGLRNALYCLAFNPGVLQSVSRDSYEQFIMIANTEVVDTLVPLVLSNRDKNNELSKRILCAIIDIPGEHSRKKLAGLLLENLPDPRWYYWIAKELRKDSLINVESVAKQLTSVGYGQKLFSVMNSKQNRIIKSKADAAKILMGHTVPIASSAEHRTRTPTRTRRQ